MFLALWEYEVKPGCEERFEKVYGPAGDWAMLFRCDSNYQETRLLRDPFRPAIYLTLDFWKSRQAHEEFLAARQPTAPNIRGSTPLAKALRSMRDAPAITNSLHRERRSATNDQMPEMSDPFPPEWDAVLCLPNHIATNPSGSRSGCTNLCGVPATRSRASAAK